MTEEKVDNAKPQTFPDHWSLFLHCTICFGFYHNPHTLECGHSFCERCLKRLAEIAKDENPDVRLRRLVLTCPTCRHPFAAKPVLLGRTRTCIVLKHLVELWKRECKTLLLSRPQHLRSICSQTEPEGGQQRAERQGAWRQGGQPITAPHVNLKEEFSVRAPPGDEYFQAVMKRVTESYEEINQEQQPDETVFKISPLHIPSEAERREDSSSESESSASFSVDDAANNVGGAANADGREVGRRDSNASLLDVFGRIGQMSIFDSHPGRILLVGMWFIYSLLIVALAEAFLPYVILFTLFFFLLFLK